MSKPRKYQITPNSIDPSEEAAVRSVMDKFRQRAEQPEPVFSESVEPVRGVTHFPTEIAKGDSFGYPNSSHEDSQEFGDVGNPNVTTLDIHTISFGNPDASPLDSHPVLTGYPDAGAVGNPTDDSIGNPNVESLARKIAQPQNRPSEAASDIAKAKSLASQNSSETGKWKKYDKARSTETVFIRADAELVNEVKHFNVEYKLQMREFFELAAAAFMEEQSKPKRGHLASNIALEDRGLKIRFKTDKRIINLYQAYNQIFSPDSVWKVGDDKHGMRFNEIPIEVVEMGIMHCQTNKLESDPECRINSFKYYAKQIDQYLMYADYDPKMLQTMVHTGRRRWRETTGREVDLEFLESSE